MDLTKTLARLQGFLGEGVMVSVSSEPVTGEAFPVAMLIGPLSRGLEAPLIRGSGSSLEVVRDGSLNFLVGQPEGSVSGSFLLSASQFKSAHWSCGGNRRTLIIHQAGVVTTITRVADLPLAQQAD